LTNVSPERVHLMVQCMEAWIVADPDALAGFYKQNFKMDSLPKRPNLEDEPKTDLYEKLKKSYKRNSKGRVRQDQARQQTAGNDRSGEGSQTLSPLHNLSGVAR